VCVKIDLSQILNEPESFAETVELSAELLDPGRVAGPISVRLEGTVRPLGDHFLVGGRATATGRLSCGRCLEPVDWSMDTTFDFEAVLAAATPLDPEIALDEADLDLVVLEAPELDVTELAVEQVELELPIRVVCSEDCAGLCPRCGGNRNTDGACRCEPETDPRWESLRDLAGGSPVD
jgi:uncharacterized protein